MVVFIVVRGLYSSVEGFRFTIVFSGSAKSSGKYTAPAQVNKAGKIEKYFKPTRETQC